MTERPIAVGHCAVPSLFLWSHQAGKRWGAKLVGGKATKQQIYLVSFMLLRMRPTKLSCPIEARPAHLPDTLNFSYTSEQYLAGDSVTTRRIFVNISE